tara:strand:+ start:449 stop:634 length:186 start_codon:yes stop_codon:yes gene_type:complete
MTNGNDLVEYEENNFDTLVRMFIIQKYKEEWNNFVEQEYNNTFSYEEDRQNTIVEGLGGDQ